MNLALTNLPFPPSVNTYWRHTVVGGKPRTLISKTGRAYRERVIDLVIERHKHPTINEPISLTVNLFPPDKRRRDIDNSLKALLDALQHAGVYEDDYLIDQIIVTRRKPVTGGSCTVYIETGAVN